MKHNDVFDAESDANESLDRADTELIGEVPAWQRYLGALLCIAVAFAVRYWLTPLLGEELPFMLFIAASLVAAWYGGAAAGTVALLLGLFLADYFFLARPDGRLAHSAELLYFVRYVFTASLGIALIETLHRSRRKLRREMARRQRAQTALLEAQAQLKTHAQELERCVTNRTAELADTVKYLESLLYHIGHNLRAPLRAMEGYASVLVEEYGSKLDATAREYSAHISDAAKRMDELIHDLLEYGRLGYVPLPTSDLSLDQTIDKVLFRLGFEIRKRNARVEVAGPLPKVRAHGETLEQVLTNLIENALKFVAPDRQPLVRIRAEPREGRVRLWIEDNGPGVPLAYRERIFGVFETLQPTHGRPGTGIGLAIVKQGMQRLGGSVGVEGAPGGGSHFWIELPSGDELQVTGSRLQHLTANGRE
ncbi:MAG TPA: ATP-binding protein [Verrucomicrobiae bacterium]|nr:ATP-binding protein [Verrucomicrobiae bacterium]